MTLPLPRCRVCDGIWGPSHVCREKPIRPRPDSVVQYVAIGRAVMKGQEHIATACSNTMARRIANALRKYVPNQKGV